MCEFGVERTHGKLSNMERICSNITFSAPFQEEKLKTVYLFGKNSNDSLIPGND